MAKSILFCCALVMLFRPHSFWIINDINPQMLSKSVFNDAIDDVQAASLLKQISFIFPGTKWCGAGNIAENEDDLGSEKEADMCCREHDHCPDTIPGGGTKHNLTNNIFYTRLSCSCDETFYSCLKSADTKTSKLIGNIYFNALQTKCFREDYPTVACIKKGGWFKTKCLQYSYDTNGQKVYQWFDVQDF